MNGATSSSLCSPNVIKDCVLAQTFAHILGHSGRDEDIVSLYFTLHTMIWLDSLDLPNFVHFPVHFVEHYAEPRYPAENVDSNASPIVFRWERMRTLLDASDEDHNTKRYLKADGSESMFQALQGSYFGA